MTILPKGSEIAREAVVLIGGAILAALILSQLPKLRSWINDNTKGCDCER